MSLATTLRDRFEETLARVADAARRSGRAPSDVLVVAVSKFAEPDQIRELIRLGHRDFGENRAQQLLQRAAQTAEFVERGKALPGIAPGAALPDSIRWHMIGRLQRNKIRKIADAARLIHSVDSLRVAEEIQSAALRRDNPVDVLLQINCSEEPQKGGVAIPAAAHLAEQIETMVNVRLRGVMTMAAIDASDSDCLRTFERCRECFEDIRRHGIGADRSGPAGFNILSMGMSRDFHFAIAQGANLVRIGSAIFGAPPPDALHDADED